MDDNADKCVPEYVEGIPTAKKMVKERFELIREYYAALWKQLQRDYGKNAVHNRFLDADVFVVRNESDKKTSHEALHNWKSTYAVKHLKTVIENAAPMDGLPMFSSVKNGLQKKNGYKNMILLYYTFSSETRRHLNFTAKLTIGVTSENKHIQYSVNKVEVK